MHYVNMYWLMFVGVKVENESEYSNIFGIQNLGCLVLQN